MNQINFGLSKALLLIFCFTGLLSLMSGKKVMCQHLVTEKNITFIEYPDFPDAHSTWGSIGYNPKYNTVHIGVTNHRDNVALYEYDVSIDKMKLDGFIKDLGHLRSFQWQGKIHSKIIAAPDGTIYFSTDGGESREEYLMNHPHGYGGGFFMKWDPATNHFENLGMGLQYESIKDLELDPETGNIYGISYPQAHFLVYNPAKNDIRDMGRLASTHVPRVLFTDDWGNCYYVDWRQRLVKYEKSKDELLFAKESLPSFPNTPGGHIVTGITAYAKDQKNGIIYLITYGAKILSFEPRKQGIGPVKDLGGVINTIDGEDWRPYVPNLSLGNNGKLYYFIGGHGNFVKEDVTVFVEFDPQSGEKKILFEYHVSQVNEATGSDVRDKEGNLYFLGRRTTQQNPASAKSNEPETEVNRPFLIKFNPDKEVKR